MQYSNDDTREALKTAKNRAIQEASRIASSAYIMAFTHSLMSKIYNGTLLGAFSTCFMTSVASDSLARAVVGVPLTRKTHEELIKIEFNSNLSPCILKPIEGDSFVQMVLPVRLKNEN